MKLGLALGYSGATLRLPVERVQLAERLGFDSVWTAEAYESDAITPLAYLAAVTKRIRRGTGIMQLAARPPAAAAMAMGTLDALAGSGRVIAGLGVSGPQIVEGWYGQPWGRPTRACGTTSRSCGRSSPARTPCATTGRRSRLPYTGPGSVGLGKPLTSILHMNPHLPIWLGTGTESNVKLTAEVADGWLPLGFTPARMKGLLPWLEEGFRRAGEGKSLRDLEIQPGVPVLITDDVRAALQTLKPRVALYVGGMGHRSKNFHKAMMVERGFGEAAERIQELIPSGTEGRGDGRGARRLRGRGGAGGAGGTHPRAVSRVGGLRHHGHDGVDPADRGDGADGEHHRRAGERDDLVRVECRVRVAGGIGVPVEGRAGPGRGLPARHADSLPVSASQWGHEIGVGGFGYAQKIRSSGETPPRPYPTACRSSANFSKPPAGTSAGGGARLCRRNPARADGNPAPSPIRPGRVANGRSRAQGNLPRARACPPGCIAVEDDSTVLSGV